MDIKNRTENRVISFNRGQFSNAEVTTIPANAATQLENVVIDELGNATQRKGLKLQGENPDSLISHYTFDDSSSNDDKDSNTGTDTAITYVAGKFGQAASFNGTTSKIVVTASTNIDVNSMGTFTLSAWVFVDSDGENSVGRIIDKTDDRASPTKGYVLNVQNESGSIVKLRFWIKFATTPAEVITSTDLPMSVWNKVEAVLQSDNSLDIYINGQKAAYSTDTTGVGAVADDSTQDLVIGNGTASDATFDGEIDDVHIYNAARTDAEINLSKVYGLTRFRVPGVIDRVYRTVGTTLQRLDTNFKDFTDIDTGFTTDLETNFVTGRASDGTYRLFIFNGTDNVHSMTTGEVITDEGNTNTDPPKGSQAEWHDNRLFVINSTGDINYSDILDGQTFDRSTNIFRTKTPSKAIKTFKDKQLVIYETRGIEILDTSGSTPLTDWSKTVFNEFIEFNSPRTIVNAGDDQIFLADDGVRLLSRTQFDKIQSGVISGPVQDIIRRINKDQIQKACAWFIDNKYVLAIPLDTASENNFLLIWDALAARLSGDLSNGWTVIPLDTWFPAVFTEHDFNDNKISLVMGDNRKLSLTYQAFTNNNDNGAEITSIVSGIEHTFDNVSDAIWDPLNVVTAAGIASTMTVSLDINRGGFVALDSTIDLTGGAPTLPIALEFTLGGTDKVRKLFRTARVGRGRTCRVQMKHSTYNKQPIYNEYTLYGRKLNPRVTT